MRGLRLGLARFASWLLFANGYRVTVGGTLAHFGGSGDRLLALGGSFVGVVLRV